MRIKDLKNGSTGNEFDLANDIGNLILAFIDEYLKSLLESKLQLQ